MSFMEGFAGSLGQYFTRRAAQEQDDATWEKRQKKMMELESQRIDSVIYAKGANGEVTAQPVNAAKQPVGPPRPASPAEAQEYEEGVKSRERQYRKDEAAIKADEARTKKTYAEIAEIPNERARADRQAKAYETQATAGAAASYAGAEASRASAKGKSIENQLLENWMKNNPDQLPPTSIRGGMDGKANGALTSTQRGELDHFRMKATENGWDISVLEGMPEDLSLYSKLKAMANNKPPEEEASATTPPKNSLDSFYASQRLAR